ncbi:MAG TPA: glycosyltransferase family 1 protein [Flavisolibacter sp.]|nr:glycosyltransferase family 1 protein [Flavisolibacter sp.]
MNIAVNTRFLLKDRLEGIGYFTQEVFNVLARQYPQHRFYFLFDQAYSRDFIFSENVHPLVVSPPTRHPLLWKYWFDIKLPLVLKKIKADVFVSTDGFCSLTTTVPQCLVVHDLGFLHQPGAYRKSHLRFYRHYTPKFLKKAKQVATVSQFSKNDIVKQYGKETGKITVVYNGVKEAFQPASFEEQFQTKEVYTSGKEFFLYTGAIQPRKNLINLLKAFSIFKKRQKSEMKLVLAGRLAWKNETFLQLFKTYKYRDDVILTGYLSEKELARLTAAAYALVYPSLFEGFGVPVLEAMKCGVPALTSANTSMQEIGEDAALYFDPADHADIADKLMLIYKDENLRNRLRARGKTVAEKYSWQRTGDLLWESILKAAEKK